MNKTNLESVLFNVKVSLESIECIESNHNEVVRQIKAMYGGENPLLSLGIIEDVIQNLEYMKDTCVNNVTDKFEKNMYKPFDETRAKQYIDEILNEQPTVIPCTIRPYVGNSQSMNEELNEEEPVDFGDEINEEIGELIRYRKSAPF